MGIAGRCSVPAHSSLCFRPAVLVMLHVSQLSICGSSFQLLRTSSILILCPDLIFYSSFHPESNPSVFHEIQAEQDPRNFRRENQFSETKILLRSWYTIVGQYRNRRLTFEKDKFPALSGLAMEMAERIKYTYVAGLWLEDIHDGLLWSTIGTYCRSPDYVAPSVNSPYVRIPSFPFT